MQNERLGKDQPIMDYRHYLKPFTFLFNDLVMGLLAIAALGMTIAPHFFDLTDQDDDWVDVIEWVIVCLFAIEYCLYLLLSHDRPRFIRNPWRILDLGIILVSALTLIPGIPDRLRHTLALRLLRIFRALVFGLRATPWMLNHSRLLPTPPLRLEPRSFVIHQEGEHFKPIPLAWAEFLQSLGRREHQWFDTFNIGLAELPELERGSGVPRIFLQQAIGPHNYPRLETVNKHQIITTWLTTVTMGKVPEIQRTSVMLAILDSKVMLTMAARDCGLWERVLRKVDRNPALTSSRVQQGALAFFRTILDLNEEALTHLEGYLRVMEDAPIARSGTPFFQVAFQLRKNLSQIRADLWRISGILKAIDENRIRLPWLADDDDCFDLMRGQASYLYETADNLREGLLSLIELHMNANSFQMNRVMKVLAVVSSLGLIPATIGGLLGMNILGTPWPLTLPQVIFLVVMLVVAVLYIFLATGGLD
jgi:Mg2+ and Co2+ transporter CorA